MLQAKIEALMDRLEEPAILALRPSPPVAVDGEHSMTSPDTYGIEVSVPRRRIGATHHQLLGHAPASQGVEVRPDDVLLLHLVSDRGVDFMFCGLRGDPIPDRCLRFGSTAL
jgi:hypothetical protein